MSAKENMFTFLEMLFVIALAAIAAFYFIAGDRIGFFTELMRRAWPLIAMCGLCLFRLRSNRRAFKRKKEEGSAEIVLYLDYNDKMIADAILFGLPTLILFLPMAIKADIAAEDMLQAAISFILLYYYQNRIFKKAS